MDTNDRVKRVLGSFIVTIDGPAGTGKSTTASLVARRMNLLYLDTGAMYRAVTVAVLRRAIDPEDEAKVTAVARGIELELGGGSDAPTWFLDGVNVDRELRTPGVSAAVSPVSRHAGVRRSMVALQRRLGARGGIVMEGRDTGSVVFPYAHLKVFLTADIETRARRRQAQLREIGIEEGLEDIARNIAERDRIDSDRPVSPLLRPPGSLLIDTSSITIEEQVRMVEAAAHHEAHRIAELSVGKKDRNPCAAMRLCYGISHVLVQAVFRIVFGLRIYGRENMQYRENFIFASNHLSYADPLVVGGSLPREVYFLAKKELFRNRIFGGLIRTYHAIPVDREDIERSTMKRILERLSSGASILMFPEGTRSRTGEIGPLKPGLGFTAIRSGVSIVPVHVTGSNHLARCVLRQERLEVRIGPPIRIAPGAHTEDRKRDYVVLTNMVYEELRMLRDEATA
jgi:cytidylate kinase